MNVNQLLLEKLINSPALLKELEKLVKGRPTINKAIKEKKAGNPTYVNRVTVRCKLCGSEQIIFMRMDWDAEDKLYRTGCHAFENLWPLLSVHELYQRSASCSSCLKELEKLTKEELINKVIYLSNRGESK